MGNEQSSPTSPTARRASEIAHSVLQRPVHSPGQAGRSPAYASRPSAISVTSSSSASNRRSATNTRPNPLGEPRRSSPPSVSPRPATSTLQASAPVSRTPSRPTPQPSPQPAAPPPLPPPRVERTPPAVGPPATAPSTARTSRPMTELQAERPISQLSVNSAGAPPPPYSPVDERLVQEIAALMGPAATFAEPEEQDPDQDGEERFSTPTLAPQELPSPVATVEQAPGAAYHATSHSISRSSPRPSSSQRRHHTGSSSGSSTHRRTQSTSSHAHTHRERDRDLPPTPTPEGDEDDLPPTIRPHGPGTVRDHRPPTPPQSAGSRHTSFRVRSPTPTFQTQGQEPAPELTRQTSHGTHGSARSRGSHRRRGSDRAEDPLVLLKKYDTVILVDDSVSMADLWEEAKTALAEIASLAARYDIDGVDIYFVNDRHKGIGLRTAEAVVALFDSVQPSGADSEIAGRLEEFLLPYLARAERYQEAVEHGNAAQLGLAKVRPINFIVLTDGVPSDDPESVIVAAARRLDAHNFPLSQVGIQFVQLGDEMEATEVLQHLDDGLGKAYGVRDMVDWTLLPEGRLDAAVLTKILLGGINRRVDGKAGH